MIETAAIIGGSVFGGLILTTVIANLFGIIGILKKSLQTVGLALIGMMLFQADLIGYVLLGIIVLIPLTIGVLSFLFVFWYTYRALNGKLGDEAKWMAELMRDDDNAEFAQAALSLPEQELNEIRIIAESKQELHDLIIKRANNDKNNNN